MTWEAPSVVVQETLVDHQIQDFASILPAIRLTTNGGQILLHFGSSIYVLTQIDPEPEGPITSRRHTCRTSTDWAQKKRKADSGRVLRMNSTSQSVSAPCRHQKIVE